LVEVHEQLITGSPNGHENGDRQDKLEGWGKQKSEISFPIGPDLLPPPVWKKAVSLP
jgi:hypothetical protein